MLPVFSRVTGTVFGPGFLARLAGRGQAWSLLAFTAAVTLASAWITVVSLRLEAHRLIAGLARLVRDVGLAEDCAQDALVAALEQWPRDGVPDAPGPWLMTVARRRAIDAMRRRDTYAAKLVLFERDAELGREPATADLDDHIGDDVLRLIFTAAHPVLPADGRAALILRTPCGLSTPGIARAFLVPEATAAQRIVRAKRTLADAGVRFEMPTPAETAQRLSTVLGVVYLIFNEGYAATAGDDWARPDLCGERCGSAACWPACCPARPRCTACSR